MAVVIRTDGASPAPSVTSRINGMDSPIFEEHSLTAQ
jgi:hypothetical protein